MKKYDKEIRYRLTEEEKALLVAKAKEKNMSQSDLVRLAIRIVCGPK